MKKMNISLSMGFLKPIKNFFRKYTALLPSIAITIIALLLLVPTMLTGRSVEEKMKSSVQTADNVSRLLKDVPSEDTPDLVKRYMDRLEEEAVQIETLAVETTRRELISYDVFPPRGSSSQLYVDFGNKFRAGVERLIDDMDARDAPNDAEIRAQTGAGERRSGGMDYGYGTRRQQDDTTAPMVDALCLQRAQEISVYAHPSVFPWYDFWGDYKYDDQGQALEDCWDTQVVFWCCQDIAATISTMNKGAKDVFSSPVKRLMDIGFSGPLGSGRSGMGYYGGRETQASRQVPNYIILPDTDTATTMNRSAASGNVAMYSNFVSDTLTKRGCNEEVDVLHFAFSVLVDNRYVMAFMKELCSGKPHTYRVDFQKNGQEKNAVHNQITIVDTEISVVQKDDVEHELYRYGEGAVMQLDLVCEYQFFRKGYDVIKPEPIKERLGQMEETQEKQSPGTSRPGMPLQ